MKVGGVVEALVELMMKGSEAVKFRAVKAVWELACTCNAENQVWAPPAWPSAIWVPASNEPTCV